MRAILKAIYERSRLRERPIHFLLPLALGPQTLELNKVEAYTFVTNIPIYSWPPRVFFWRAARGTQVRVQYSK